MDVWDIRKVSQLYSGKDNMHDFRHIRRIWHRVGMYRCGCGYPVDAEKLRFLVLYHGLAGYVRENEGLFVAAGVPGAWLQALYRHTILPVSIEEQLVSDANLCEAVGVFGIRKALQVGFERGQALQETISIMSHNAQNARFYTRMGKACGEPGVEVVERWVEGFIFGNPTKSFKSSSVNLDFTQPVPLLITRELH